MLPAGLRMPGSATAGLEKGNVCAKHVYLGISQILSATWGSTPTVFQNPLIYHSLYMICRTCHSVGLAFP